MVFVLLAALCLQGDAFALQPGNTPSLTDTTVKELSAGDTTHAMTIEEESLIGEDTITLEVPHHVGEDVWDSLYRARLSAIPSSIPLPYNEYVRSWIELYTVKKPYLVEKALAMSKLYYPMFEDVFASMGMPTDLKHLSVVESVMNPHAVSRMGATGIWQFMYRTAKLYQLRINAYLDERKDPRKSTEAAARYLNTLYGMYSDWLLAVAAYNCGEGNVNRALRLANGETGFWNIRHFLPRETRGYVPAFIAATYVMHYADEHGIAPRDMDSTFISFDNTTVDVVNISNNKVHLKTLSKYLDISEDQLAYLNPGLKYKVVPNLPVECGVNLPCDKVVLFHSLRDSILNDPMNEQIKAVPQERTYRVRPGDNLSAIAARHGCTVNQLKEWNNIRGTLIRPGQVLVLYSRAPRSTTTAAVPKQAVTSSSAAANTAQARQNTSGQYKKFVYYRVNSGDTLWDIAKKYPGVTAEDIRRVNNISNVKQIRPGDQIRIPVGG